MPYISAFGAKILMIDVTNAVVHAPYVFLIHPGHIGPAGHGLLMVFIEGKSQHCQY